MGTLVLHQNRGKHGGDLWRGRSCLASLACLLGPRLAGRSVEEVYQGGAAFIRQVQLQKWGVAVTVAVECCWTRGKVGKYIRIDATCLVGYSAAGGQKVPLNILHLSHFCLWSSSVSVSAKIKNWDCEGSRDYSLDAGNV